MTNPKSLNFRILSVWLRLASSGKGLVNKNFSEKGCRDCRNRHTRASLLQDIERIAFCIFHLSVIDSGGVPYTIQRPTFVIISQDTPPILFLSTSPITVEATDTEGGLVTYTDYCYGRDERTSCTNL